MKERILQRLDGCFSGDRTETQPVAFKRCKNLAQTLSSLKDGISRYNIKYNTGNGTPLVFHHLTFGLSDSLITLQRGLRSCASEDGSDTLDASDCHFELDSESMEEFQTRLHPISMGIEIINEAMEMVLMESSGIRSSGTVEEICKRIDEAKNSSARLSHLLDSFIYGITSQTKLETTDGRDLHTFTSANISHREVGQKIATRLRQETGKAVSVKQEDEGELAWMIRHSVYWLSKSSEDLREWQSVNGSVLSTTSERARHTIAKTFLDAMKAAWLLCDLGDLRAYEEPSFEIREVVACAKKKVLSLLQSFYRDLFTVPNYDLINDVGDFDMCTDDERKEKASKHSDANSNLSALVTEPETMHKGSEDSNLPAELEAGSLVSPTDSDLHESPLQLTPTLSKLTNSSAFCTTAESANTADVAALADGLHLTHLEAPPLDHQYIDHTPAGLRYNELSNAEIRPLHNEWAGFRYNLLSKDSNPPHNTAFIPTRVRIFKLDDSQASSYLQLEIYRDALPMSQSVIKPSTTTLVPIYAFAADRSESAELYLSDSGMQPNLRYQFICKDSNGDHHPWELYGFQGALMGADFESDYSPVSVSMHHCGSSWAESERFPRIQVWTDFPGGQPAVSDSSSHESRSMTSASSSSTQSSISSKGFSALTSHVTHNVNDTKIFIFSQNFIYVLLVSERVTLMRPKPSGLLQHGRNQKQTRVRFVPNKGSGTSTIRVHTLKGTRSMPAGIPLDGRGIRYGDQERPDGGFEDLKSIEFDFECEDHATEFIAHYNEYVEGWRRRCAPVDSFRELQRNRHISVSSRTTFIGGGVGGSSRGWRRTLSS